MSKDNTAFNFTVNIDDEGNLTSKMWRNADLTLEQGIAIAVSFNTHLDLWNETGMWGDNE